MNLSFSACSCCRPTDISRGNFIKTAGAATVAAMAALRVRSARASADQPAFVPFPGVPIIDIHQHCLYRGRPEDKLLLHQKNTGIRTSIILASADPMIPACDAAGNEYAAAFAREHASNFAYFTSVHTGRPDAVTVLETYLKNGALGIGELKNQVKCDSPGVLRAAEVAREYDVPMLLHFQDLGPKSSIGFNDGFAHFHRVLEKFPTVKFIAHAQTFWAYADKNYRPEQGLYPRGPMTPGGLTDRWLADYPNFYGDLSAGSGNGALARDTAFSSAFLARHQDKLMYGSDCNCPTGVGPACIGAVKLGFLRQLCPDATIRDKLLFGNARKLVRFSAAQLAST